MPNALARREPSGKSKLIFGSVLFHRRLFALFRQPIFLYITLWGHSCICLGTAAFYYFEHQANPRIQSVLDTLVWTIATVTTVGYGDATPVTTGGKIVSIVMMVTGSLFLWSYTALLVGALIGSAVEQVEYDVRDLEKGMKTDEALIRELIGELRRRRGNESGNL